MHLTYQKKEVPDASYIVFSSRSCWGCQITDNGLSRISVANCVSNLTSISLWGMTGITDKGAVQLVRYGLNSCGNLASKSSVPIYLNHLKRSVPILLHFPPLMLVIATDIKSYFLATPQYWWYIYHRCIFICHCRKLSTFKGKVARPSWCNKGF